MASKQGVKSRKSENVVSSSTTSSSKQHYVADSSIDSTNSPALSSARNKLNSNNNNHPYSDAERSKENVTVTVRFRPLSPKEIRQGEEIAWYADGENIVRNEHNSSIAYAYDRVFSPTTTTRHVYDVAAQHVVSGSMEGINGTIFAYGVTSSGKTHTMHGDQRSPGITPLAVKDAFSIIQETPSREFLLRISYIEIYNEVVNDLLNPAGQNLRIREDHQGIFVEGVKEEVVLSPAHALSLIAAGEEHRHIGSTNFNFVSSRSHSIFTLCSSHDYSITIGRVDDRTVGVVTQVCQKIDHRSCTYIFLALPTIESSPCGEHSEGEAVNLSQLHLIDLAGSESSKVETTGVRRKEGSYINKSLLTLGTVISKLTEGRATHIPYRDSKLTRILQSSLSGHGRVSLICTVAPASSNAEETHNTLKFAHRAKHIEIQAEQNKIIDENSLIKKYQNEIRLLKDELEQLKKGIAGAPQHKATGGEDVVHLKEKLEDGQFKLQSRLEQEEEAKAALLSRIQRLTNLILVSTKSSQSSRLPRRPGHTRRHSFGEEELAYLPHKTRDFILDEENIDMYMAHDVIAEIPDDTFKDVKKSRKNGLMNWLKPRKKDGILVASSDKSSVLKSNSTPSTPQAESVNFHADSRISPSLHTERSGSTELSPVARSDRETPEGNFSGKETPLTSTKSFDQIDLLRQQKKILSGEIALHSSALKRMPEEAAPVPKKLQIHDETRKLKEEIKAKNEQIISIENQIADIMVANHNMMDKLEMSQTISELLSHLNEKSFELELQTVDNRIIQDQLNQKSCKCEKLEAENTRLNQELSVALESRNVNPEDHFESQSSLVGIEMIKDHSSIKETSEKLLIRSQANEIEELKEKMTDLTVTNDHLERQNKKLAEESSYAKELASAAAVELKALSEEVTKLMNQNARLSIDLTALKNSPTQRRTVGPPKNARRENQVKRHDHSPTSSDLKTELTVSKEREMAYEAALQEKEQMEVLLQRKVEESKQREAYLENELANMWVIVSRLKQTHETDSDNKSEMSRESQRNDNL